MSEEEKSEEEKRSEEEWARFLTTVPLSQNKLKKENKQLSKLIALGIPMSYRPFFWMHLASSVSSPVKLPFSNLSNLSYNELLQEAKANPPEHQKLIIGDARRTFPDHPQFQGASTPTIESLIRILLAYNIRNPELGYCQGMNLLVASFLILGIKEQDAFYLYCTVVEVIMPKDYYTSKLLGAHGDQEVFQMLLQKHLPKLSNHLTLYNIPLQLITLSWFLTGYISTLPFEVCLRVWDCLLYYGNPFLFCVGISLLKFFEDKILTCQDSGEIYNIILHSPKSMTNGTELIETALKLQKSISANVIDPLRFQARNELVKQYVTPEQN